MKEDKSLYHPKPKSDAKEVKKLEWIDILTGVIAIGILILVVWRQIVRYKKNSNNGCEGGCGSCQWSDKCTSHAKKEDDSKK